MSTLSDLPPDVSAGATASHAAPLPPAPDQAGGGRPAAALLPPLDPALLQTRVPRHRGSAHVGGLLGTLSGQGKSLFCIHKFVRKTLHKLVHRSVLWYSVSLQHQAFKRHAEMHS